MTNIQSFLSVFIGTHAPSAFEALVTGCRQLRTTNTFLVLTIFWMTATQTIDKPGTSTHTRNNNVIITPGQSNNAPGFMHVELKNDTSIREGYLLMRGSDCYTCHADTKVMTAPSYMEIAEKYRNQKNVEGRLVIKVIEGGKGEWGNDRAMNPHPELLREDVHKMVAYILHLRAAGKN